MTAISTELPSPPLILQEEPGDPGQVREGLEELPPDLFALTHNADIEALISKKKSVIRSDLRAPQDDPAFGQPPFYLSRQKKASLYVPEVTTHPDDVGFCIKDRAKDRLIASVAHQVDRKQFCIYTKIRSDDLKIGRGEGNIFVAEEKIVGLDRKLEQ
jgi:hypothetical protein